MGLSLGGIVWSECASPTQVSEGRKCLKRLSLRVDRGEQGDEVQHIPRPSSPWTAKARGPRVLRPETPTKDSFNAQLISHNDNIWNIVTLSLIHI